jgi:hypothetical protein
VDRTIPKLGVQGLGENAVLPEVTLCDSTHVSATPVQAPHLPGIGDEKYDEQK